MQRRQPPPERHQCRGAEHDAANHHQPAPDQQVAGEYGLQRSQRRTPPDQQPAPPEQPEHLALQFIAIRAWYAKRRLVDTRHASGPYRQIAREALSAGVNQQVDRIRIQTRGDPTIDFRDQWLDADIVEHTFQTENFLLDRAAQYRLDIGTSNPVGAEKNDAEDHERAQRQAPCQAFQRTARETPPEVQSPGSPSR